MDYLEESGKEFEVIEYLKDSPNKTLLESLLKKLNMTAFELIRKGELEYKENFKGKDLSESDWIDAMVQFPKLYRTIRTRLRSRFTHSRISVIWPIFWGNSGQSPDTNQMYFYTENSSGAAI